MIDAHIHLDQYPKDQIDALIELWKTNGIQGIVAVSTNLASSYETLFWKDKYPDFIYALIGYHPEQPFPLQPEIDELFSLIRNEKDRLSGIGEIGLPHYMLHQLSEQEVPKYMELFNEFAILSKEVELPLAIHAVHDKAKVGLDILLKNNIKKAHFHWLKAPQSVLDQIIKSNYFISITPEVCYRERDQQLAFRVPIQQLLLETDGPWPFEGVFSNQKTSPLFLYQSARVIAELKQIPLAELVKRCDENVGCVY